jgi:hypothetical protein
MSIENAIVHERMLLGAMDSFLKELVHVRPFLVARYEEALTTLAERWLAGGGENQLAALDSGWLESYLTQSEQGAAVEAALADFYRWAIRARLVQTNPLSHTLERVMPE